MSLPELYSALADPTRLRVLEMLHVRSRPVHELAAAFDISRPAISRHLRVLKDAGLVKEEKQGRENVYSFQRAPLRDGIGWIEKHGAKPAAKARPAKPAAEPAPAPVPEPLPAPAIEVKAPKVSRTKPAAKPAAMPPPAPAAAPQLSFFDL
jgi:DNA-binding transcriptional ArsR family regulator